MFVSRVDHLVLDPIKGLIPEKAWFSFLQQILIIYSTSFMGVTHKISFIYFGIPIGIGIAQVLLGSHVEILCVYLSHHRRHNFTADFCLFGSYNLSAPFPWCTLSLSGRSWVIDYQLSLGIYSQLFSAFWPFVTFCYGSQHLQILASFMRGDVMKILVISIVSQHRFPLSYNTVVI